MTMCRYTASRAYPGFLCVVVLFLTTAIIDSLASAADPERRVLSGRDGSDSAFASLKVCVPPGQTTSSCSWITLAQGAVASTYFETGFEPAEGYTVGSIDGQSSWSASASGVPSAHPSVSDDNASSGVQHMRCAPDPAFSTDTMLGALRSFDPAGPGPCTISFDLNISHTGGAWYGIAGYDGDGPSADWQIGLDPDDPGGDGVPGDIRIFNGSATSNTATEYVPGVYRNLRIEMDDTQDSLKLVYGGVVIHDGSYSGGPTKVIIIFYQNDPGSMMDIDSFVVNCEGEAILGACCMRDGDCVDNQSRVECRELDGLSWRSELACGVTTCDGACCLTARSCVENMTVAECEGANGDFRGVAAPCPTPSCGGACCLADATCVDDQRESDCENLDGLFKGRGTECETVSCCPDDPDADGVTGCDDVCPFTGRAGGVDGDPHTADHPQCLRDDSGVAGKPQRPGTDQSQLVLEPMAWRIDPQCRHRGASVFSDRLRHHPGRYS